MPNNRLHLIASTISLAAGILLLSAFLPVPASGTSGIGTNPHALLKTGEIVSGTWMLPSGRIIKPIGTRLGVGALPLGLVLSPDGNYLFVTNGGSGAQSITVVDTNTGEIIQTVEEDALYLGLAISHDGTILYASGGGKREILVYDIEHGILSLKATLAAKGIPGGISLSRTGEHVFYVSQYPRMVHALDAETGEFLNSSFTGENPYTVISSPVKDEIYLSLEGDNKVSIFNTTLPGWIRCVGTVDVGKNPQGMTISSNGRYLFVTNSDDDSFSVIDTGKRTVIATLDLRHHLRNAPGTAPNAAALAPDGKRLYIAQASDNKVSVFSLPDGESVGAIPTAWYPTALVISPDGGKIYIASGKGTGTSPAEPGDGLVNNGLIQLADIPSDSELASYADSIETYNTLPGNLFDVDTLNFESPVPLERGGPTPIKHVIFIVRENKTYDAILGDWEGGDGDPSKCIYCYEETRNLHAMVENFGSGDNYYSNAEASIQGHNIVTAAITNPFVEKQWAMDDRTIPIEADVFFNPAAYPKNDFIFQNALNNDVSFRVYGEAVGLGKDLLIFDLDYVHWGIFDPPFFFMYSKDVSKLWERKLEWNLGIFPELIFMLFPNDHTLGYQWPFPTPEEMVTDNDLASGEFLEWLSTSEYWEESVVIMVEDDPQQGEDHIDNHRSILVIASPWVKRGYVSPVHYSEANLHATIQHILGLPPMTIYDEIAQPMWDIFSNDPDYTPFEAVDTGMKGEFNLPGTVFAKRSMGLNFLDPDEAEGLPGLVADYREALDGMEDTPGNDTISAITSDFEIEDGSSAACFKKFHEFCLAADLDNMPKEALNDLESFYSNSTLKLTEEYRTLRNNLNADILPPDPLLVFARQASESIVRMESISTDSQILSVHYSNGLKGELKFIQEDENWKIELREEIGNAVNMLMQAQTRMDRFDKARAAGEAHHGGSEPIP